jgi:hypothetical protein
MEEQDTSSPEMVAEATAYFAVLVQGNMPRAVVVEGLDGVKQAVLQAVWKTPDTVLGGAAAAISTLDDPEAWAHHGLGDGRPYWHWWLGYEGGSVTVQRLTEAVPSRDMVGRLRVVVADAIAALTDCKEVLRQFDGRGLGGYIFTSRFRPRRQD